jgi:hypothetical protein
MKSIQLFPVREGEAKYITNIELNAKSFFDFGIYHCNVEKCYNNLFKNCKNNYYTHIDLKRAKELHLKIDMIVDGQPNFLYYSRDKLLTGFEIFGNYIDLLFGLKEKKLTSRSKSILNILWGALAEKKLIKHSINNDDTLDTNLGISDTKIISIRPLNDDITLIQTSKNDKQYKFGYARLAPFLLAKGRYNISTVMTPYIDDVVRCHTDGFILSKKPDGIKTGDELGSLVYEGYSKHCIVKNCAKETGDKFIV